MDTLYDEVIEAAGTAKHLADALGEAPSTVGNWRARGFPAHRCKAIEALTGISVRRLRPDDWRLYWPDDAPARQAA